MAASAHAADVPRVASINLCTDQLVMTLADPGQILGLSPYSRDTARSWAAAEAKKFPRLSGEAEDVLALSRRGWVSGDDSVTSALLSITGLSNAATALGVKHGGFAKLETIVALKPDFILVSSSSDIAEDEGRALLLHPALEKLYPPSRRIVIPEDLTVCGGPMLADALDRLVAELKQVWH